MLSALPSLHPEVAVVEFYDRGGTVFSFYAHMKKTNVLLEERKNGFEYRQPSGLFVPFRRRRICDLPSSKKSQKL